MMRNMLEEHVVEDDAVHGYESMRIDSSTTPETATSQPKALKKSDHCRLLISENITSEPSEIIALISEECKLTMGLAKKYYNNNVSKVTAA